MIRVSKEVERAKFLISMHDGAVYQIYNLWYDVVKDQVETIYIEEFKKVCPKLNCKVNVKEILSDLNCGIYIHRFTYLIDSQSNNFDP